MKTAGTDYQIFEEHHSFHVCCRVDEEILELYRRSKCDRLVIDHRSSNVEHLIKLNTKVIRLEIRNDEVPDYGFIQAFGELASLHTSVPLGSVQFSQFPRLRVLGISQQPLDATAIASCKSLEELILNGVKLRNYEGIGHLKSLKAFNLVRSVGWELAMFSSLTGLEVLGIYNLKSQDCNFLKNCQKLACVMLAVSPRLDSIAGLPTEALLELQLRTCTSFRSLNSSGGFSLLEKVIIENCPALATLDPLIKAKKLKLLELWDKTDVRDGKLRQMLELPCLTRFSFKNRRHYDLKVEEAQRLGATRKN